MSITRTGPGGGGAVIKFPLALLLSACTCLGAKVTIQYRPYGFDMMPLPRHSFFFVFETKKGGEGSFLLEAAC